MSVPPELPPPPPPQLLWSTSPSGMSSLNPEAVRAILVHADSNKDGYLSPAEARAVLDQLRLPVSPTTLSAFLRICPEMPSGIPMTPIKSLDNFIWKQYADLQAVFKELDVSGDGRINESDLRIASGRLNLSLSDADIKKLIKIADKNGNGTVEFDDFCLMLLSADAIHIGGVFEHWIRDAMLETGEYGQPPEEIENTPTWIHLLAGGIAGAVSRTATAPMDRLKTLLQAQGAHAAMPNGVRVTGVFHCMKEIMREGGVLSFWRGNGTNVLKIAPETACKFWAYDYLKRVVSVDPKDPSMAERLIAGGLAGAFAQGVIYPLELVKTRMALSGTGEYRGVVHCFRTTVGTEGALGLYRGLWASLVGIIPYSAVDLTVYSLLKELYSSKFSEAGEPGVSTLLLCGAASTTCGQLFTYPLQLTRTRLQAQGMKGRPVVFKGIVDCIVKTVKHDGFVGLYKGILPNFAKSLPAISLSYTVYELSTRWLTLAIRTRAS